MKKIIIVLFILIVVATLKEKNNILIPDDAIRFRVIANSNGIEDQKIKLIIKDEVEQELYKLLKNVKTIDEARIIIKNNIDKVDNVIDKYNLNYQINFGNNYFPIKEYKGITYDAGSYESLVITIGEGLGNNWWCVLFPPLCLLDEEENMDNVEYKLYVSKLINKFK